MTAVPPRIPWASSPPRPAVFPWSTTTSRYLTMRDGVKIAIDVTLPKPQRDSLPTIVRQTRYHRRFHYQPPFHLPELRQLFDRMYHARRYFVSRGYAWVDVCARGSGASGGMRPMPWHQDEIEDGREITDWIVAQPWSNGRVGARGVSYDGTSAEFMLTHGHPAIRAVAPCFSLFDAYEDIAMPGGIHLEKFTRNWTLFNSALDRNRFDEVLELIMSISEPGRAQLASSPYGREEDSLVATALRLAPLSKLVIGRFIAGVAAVDDDPLGEVLAEHFATRRPSLDVHAAGQRLTFRDDDNFSDDLPGATIDAFSPHSALQKLRSSGAAVYSYSGWFDGAYQRAAIKRWHALDDRGHRMIIGPWEHGGQQDISPWEPSREPLFDHEAELLRFFDAHLLNDEVLLEAWKSEPPVRYFTMGAERWRTTDRWPPPGFQPMRWHLGPNRRLSRNPSGEPHEDRLFVRGRHGSGVAGRWSCLLPLLTHTHYVTQSGDDVVDYRSDPLTADLEVTGHPILHVEMTSSTDDPRLFAYLEDVEPDGTSHYVTEGQLRAIHRKLQPVSLYHPSMPYRSYRREDRAETPRGDVLTLEFDLLPTSYLFRRRHSLRLVLAGADVDHFELGPRGAHHVHVHRSYLDLPVRTK